MKYKVTFPLPEHEIYADKTSKLVRRFFDFGDKIVLNMEGQEVVFYEMECDVVEEVTQPVEVKKPKRSRKARK